MTERARQSTNPDRRLLGVGAGRDTAEHWLLLVEEGTARICPDCGGVARLDDHAPHCSPESRARMIVRFVTGTRPRGPVDFGRRTR